VRAAGDADVAAPVSGGDASASAPLTRGTRIVLHLKEDAKEMADPVRLARLIRQYSQFIQFPIELWQATKESKTVTDEAATAERQKAADAALKEGDAPVKVEPVTKTDYVDVWGWRTQNDDKPLWTRSPKDVSEQDYAEFFKAAFGEFLDPLAHVHFNVEGTIEFSSVLFIPGMAPFDQQSNPAAKSRSIKLYVRRVFISDEFDDDLMPRWLSFVKGVVDSSDLPLNVSREILQESRIVRVIRKQLVRRALEMMDDLACKEGGEDYKTFWESFGRQVKVGAIEDQENGARVWGGVVAACARMSLHARTPPALDTRAHRPSAPPSKNTTPKPQLPPTNPPTNPTETGRRDRGHGEPRAPVQAAALPLVQGRRGRA